eukprot:2863432-Amphidinium_carterae.1
MSKIMCDNTATIAKLDKQNACTGEDGCQHDSWLGSKIRVIRADRGIRSQSLLDDQQGRLVRSAGQHHTM